MLITQVFDLDICNFIPLKLNSCYSLKFNNLKNQLSCILHEITIHFFVFIIKSEEVKF